MLTWTEQHIQLLTHSTANTRCARQLIEQPRYHDGGRIMPSKRETAKLITHFAKRFRRKLFHVLQAQRQYAPGRRLALPFLLPLAVRLTNNWSQHAPHPLRQSLSFPLRQGREPPRPAHGGRAGVAANELLVHRYEFARLLHVLCAKVDTHGYAADDVEHEVGGQLDQRERFKLVILGEPVKVAEESKRLVQDARQHRQEVLRRESWAELLAEALPVFSLVFGRE